MLVDTSVWIEHLRRGLPVLQSSLEEGEVWSHPFVIGELACGQIKRRNEILALLASLPQTPVAGHDEVLAFIEATELVGRGIGWIDAHLLASARLAGTLLWTMDKRLQQTARSLQLCHEP